MSTVSSHRRTQGAARYTFLIVLGLMLIAAAGIFVLLKSQIAADDLPTEVVAAAGPVMREGAGLDELLQQARQAMAEQRLVAPAGNNAFEFYLAALKREPNNRAAQDALREIFPFAAHAAEETIDEGADAEAQREIDLLTRADPRNYTLTLLQSKLQAKRDAAEQQAQTSQAAAVAKRDQPTSTASRGPTPASTPAVANATAPTPAPAAAPVIVPATKPAPSSIEQTLAHLHVESTEVKAAPRAAVQRAPVVAAVPDANGAAAPVLARRVEPTYPSDARRMRRQGWVDVIFTVQPDGSVVNASVADADPKYVFDRAALTAVARWQFSPGLQDGKPVAQQVRQRIEFRL